MCNSYFCSSDTSLALVQLFCLVQLKLPLFCLMRALPLCHLYLRSFDFIVPLPCENSRFRCKLCLCTSRLSVRRMRAYYSVNSAVFARRSLRFYLSDESLASVQLAFHLIRYEPCLGSFRVFHPMPLTLSSVGCETCICATLYLQSLDASLTSVPSIFLLMQLALLFFGCESCVQLLLLRIIENKVLPSTLAFSATPALLPFSRCQPCQPVSFAMLLILPIRECEPSPVMRILS
jgi:hypothetical protein